MKKSDAGKIYDILNDPIQLTCKSKFVQICHLCDSMVCGDNQNPLVARIKELESLVNEKETKEQCKLVSVKVTQEMYGYLKKKAVELGIDHVSTLLRMWVVEELKEKGYLGDG